MAIASPEHFAFTHSGTSATSAPEPSRSVFYAAGLALSLLDAENALCGVSVVFAVPLDGEDDRAIHRTKKMALYFQGVYVFCLR